jgi:hypothetical protein
MELPMELIFFIFHQLLWNQGKLILILIKEEKWVMGGKDLRHLLFLEKKSPACSIAVFNLHPFCN